MNAAPNPRPVLLPQGWPKEVSEREALTRVLLAAGADIERLLDTPASPDAFVRHATRMPFLRAGRERPLVAFSPNSDDVDALLQFRSMLIAAVSELQETTWIVYLPACIRQTFFRAAIRYGGLFDTGGGLHTWHISHGTLGLVSRDTWVPGLASRLEDLLAPTAESGIMPIDPPVGEFRHSSVAKTEPAGPIESDPFQEAPYAAVAARHTSPMPRRLSPAPAALSLPPQYRTGASTMPPNPRLRNR